MTDTMIRNAQVVDQRRAGNQDTDRNHEISETGEHVVIRTYDPNQLLDALIGRFNLKNDAALSRFLDVPPPVISKIRHRRVPVSAGLLIRIHEVTEISIKELRELTGDRREKFRVGNGSLSTRD